MSDFIGMGSEIYPCVDIFPDPMMTHLAAFPLVYSEVATNNVIKVNMADGRVFEFEAENVIY